MTDQRPSDETTIEEQPSAPEYRPSPAPVADDPAGGASAATATPPTARRGLALRWVLALVGIIVVAIGTAVIVSLAGGRPANSATVGYMPASVVSYSEIRLDLLRFRRMLLWLAHVVEQRLGVRDSVTSQLC